MKVYCIIFLFNNTFTHHAHLKVVNETSTSTSGTELLSFTYGNVRKVTKSSLENVPEGISFGLFQHY